MVASSLNAAQLFKVAHTGTELGPLNRAHCDRGRRVMALASSRKFHTDRDAENTRAAVRFDAETRDTDPDQDPALTP